MNVRLFLHTVISFSLIVFSCKPESSPKKESGNQEISFPSFNKDSAYQFVRTQVAFGPRVPNTAAHKNCANWLADKLRSFNADVIIQEFSIKAFDGTVLNGKNIIGKFNTKAEKRIVLAAHWDSRPFSDQDSDPANRSKPVDGADDGASGVGVLMEIGRMLSIQEIKNIGVDIVFFDCEDYGTENNTNSWGLGSQHWSKEYIKSGNKAMYGILLDMIGASSPRFQKEGFSMQYAPQVVDKVWAIAKREGYSKQFVDQISYEIIDDHYFVNTIAKLPMIDIINKPEGSPKGFVHHWHTQKDNMDAIDPFSLLMVGKVLVKLVYKEDALIL